MDGEMTRVGQFGDWVERAIVWAAGGAQITFWLLHLFGVRT
jgi:hypothetical protein